MAHPPTPKLIRTPLKGDLLTVLAAVMLFAAILAAGFAVSLVVS
jgi:hypothetical protein